jgi:hypothetical protein
MIRKPLMTAFILEITSTQKQRDLSKKKAFDLAIHYLPDPRKRKSVMLGLEERTD